MKDNIIAGVVTLVIILMCVVISSINGDVIELDTMTCLILFYVVLNNIKLSRC